MGKKILLSISLVIIMVIGIEIFEKNKKEEEKNNSENYIENATEISGNLVIDDCLDEWDDYALIYRDSIKSVDSDLSDENICYIVKENNGYINIYYVNDKNEQLLYKVTDLSIEYLPEKDVEKLVKGIEVFGAEELNKLLEDFE